MICLSILIMIHQSDWTLALLFVSDENESFGSKLYHFFCDDEKVQIGSSRSDAQLKMSTVSA